MTLGIDMIDMPPALVAQVNMLLSEMRRHNRELLLGHVYLVDKYAALFDEVAKHAREHMVLTSSEMNDTVKCAAVAFACNDLFDGAEKFLDIMRFASSWEEKVELLRVSSRAAKRTNQ
jgi:hypothetical protein